jgi:hypothetical protein
MLVFTPAAFAGSPGTSSSSDASSYVGGQLQGQALVNNPNQEVNFTQTSNIPAGQGRLLLGVPNIPSAPLINYFGPWKDPANILESNLGMPMKVTLDQAKNAYQGGVTSRINILNPVKFQVDKCELVATIPISASYRGYTFLQGDGKANSIDLLMKAYQDAMESGATKIVILKKQSSTKNKALGFSLGIGGGVSSLQGSEKENGLTVGGGTGISWGSTEPQYKDGMAVLMLE